MFSSTKLMKAMWFLGWSHLSATTTNTALAVSNARDSAERSAPQLNFRVLDCLSFTIGHVYPYVFARVSERPWR